MKILNVKVILLLFYFLLLSFNLNASSNQSLKAVNDLNTLSIALEVYFLEIGRYPTASEGLDSLIERPDTVAAEAWRGPYLPSERTLIDPWGTKYIYIIPGTHSEKEYDLYSCGIDG